MASVAEFEMRIYEIVESGGALNAETLNGIWLELRERYTGYPLTDELFPTSWPRFISLFDSHFYHYRYSVSMVAASQIVSDILGGAPGAQEGYLEFLRSGSQYDPATLLSNLGVDIASPQFYDGLYEDFSYYLELMRELMEELEILN
jgi:oligoendopeptidase F